MQLAEKFRYIPAPARPVARDAAPKVIIIGAGIAGGSFFSVPMETMVKLEAGK